ncbi:hypothetical protein IQ06DRAFT_295011 [Phaeosphaeriaceae sp. SRC1lsM3a]|nr:hypothetical protein IQ06DRAFT_295011 [Stagonospora sp. SRC1lsM3a]
MSLRDDDERYSDTVTPSQCSFQWSSSACRLFDAASIDKDHHGFVHLDADARDIIQRSDRPKVIVWYCSDCGDGPYGSWQAVCQGCGHTKCGNCESQEA